MAPVKDDFLLQSPLLCHRNAAGILIFTGFGSEMEPRLSGDSPQAQQSLIPPFFPNSIIPGSPLGAVGGQEGQGLGELRREHPELIKACSEG